MFKFSAAVIVLASLIQISSSQSPLPPLPSAPPTFDSTAGPPVLDSLPPTGPSSFDSLPPTDPPQFDSPTPTAPPQLDPLALREPPQFDPLSTSEIPQLDRLQPTDPPPFDSLTPTAPPQIDRLPPTDPPRFDSLPPTAPPQIDRLPPTEPPGFDSLPPTAPPQFDSLPSRRSLQLDPLPPTEPPTFVDSLEPTDPRQFDSLTPSGLAPFDSPLPTRPRILNSPLPSVVPTSLDSAPPAVPSSLDNYGGNVSNYSIMYTKNLQDIMQRFKISVAEMESMLDAYISGGNPTITKTVYNPDTGTNETVTLDFKSIAEGDGFPSDALQRPISSARSELPRTTDDVLNAGPGTLNTIQPTQTIPDTGSSPMSDFLRNPTPVVGNANSPESRDLDLTAFREQEAKLIDDLKLLMRRREALDQSFSRGELTDENYRISLENTDIQIRDNYAVLKQIQDAIRDYLGIGAPRAFSQQPPVVIPEASPISNFMGPDGSSGGQPLTPDEELVFIQSEIERLKQANAGLLERLQSLQMPNIDSAVPSDINEMPLNPTVRGSSMDAMNFMDSFDGATPSPSPLPSVSGVDSIPGLPGEIPGTGFPNTPSDPIPGNQMGGVIPGDDSNVIPRTQIRNDIENLLNEYNRLSQREDAILSILNQNGQAPDTLPQDITGQTPGATRPVGDFRTEMGRPLDNQNEMIPIARRASDRIAPQGTLPSEIDMNVIGSQDPTVELNSFPEIMPPVQGTGFPQTSRDPVDNARMDEVIPTEERNIISRAQIRNDIENLLNAYNRLSQREEEIIRTLNQNEQDMVGQAGATTQPVDDFQGGVNMATENRMQMPLDNINDMLPLDSPGSARRDLDRIATPMTLSIDPELALAGSQIPPVTPRGTEIMRPGFPETMDILTENTGPQSQIFDRSNIVDDVGDRLPVLDSDVSRIGDPFLSQRGPTQTVDEVSVTRTDRVRPIVNRGGDVLSDSQPSSGSSQGENLIYNDGFISMSPVQPVGSLEGDRSVPIGPAVPISGFSSEASGLLSPRDDTTSLQSRQVRFFRRRPLDRGTTSRFLLQNGGQLRYLGGRTTLRQPIRLI
ncbi:uncharacterized protein LOC134229694 [Saccostrea cucullata]|uniref:uncharacterized protein LOC134229694 n=1 Tax=Saccostrea cuccullata TaxID=36930 RepID=UPI002ED59E97